ncbi:Guanine nucleotide-binding protein subunit gamma 3 [Acorus calamus]|uniref:Guanine nucleotide-binding protein subunit gamma 3 n=1 Tax=Acorus calamus TaxID=4465 RepID=A0AAV9EQ17_ACOCL|nr:Guanine nucleotide-binding protein subunit gamma 3 [Acorus calamus]
MKNRIRKAFHETGTSHRRQVQIQSLNREIGFLEEELQSLEVIQPASKCCKEIDDYVTSNSDPLIPVMIHGKKIIRALVELWSPLTISHNLPPM